MEILKQFIGSMLALVVIGFMVRAIWQDLTHNDDGEEPL